MKKFLRYLLLIITVFAAFAWVNNTSLLTAPGAGKPVLLAHRGLHQTFPKEGVENDTCTATRIYPPEHAFIENTLPSMEAAFSAGADVVEFDVHPTTDGQFAVFHDWTLDCRTEGHGRTRDHAMTDLKRLDVGFGYTADGGKTFPLRGKGVGMMPTLDEVLAKFPGRRFLINVKSDDPKEGSLIAGRLAQLPPDERRLLMVYGGERPMAELRARVPDIPVMSGKSLKRCGLSYIAIGWSGYVPNACTNTLLLVPQNYTGLLWGWPHKFQRRMQDAGVSVFVLGPYDGSFGSTGIDDLELLAKLPQGFSGGIWTNRIDRIGPKVRGAGN